MRGRRDISSIVCTRPETLYDKKGTQGTAVKLLTNYFILNKKHDWKLCLYHVEFCPEEDRTHMKKRLMRQHKEVVGNEYIFDGMQLYLPFKLGKEVTELASKREGDDAIYQVKIKFIKELGHLDSQYLQIMGILLSRCMELLGLQLIGRNYFNPKAEARDDKYEIVIWPGFSSSIRQHEQSLLLNVDVTHKFLRSETAYKYFQKAQGNIKEVAGKYLLGNVVMTKYNERTYRIDDISWDTTPRSKFQYKGGEISYMEYYEKNLPRELLGTVSPRWDGRVPSAGPLPPRERGPAPSFRKEEDYGNQRGYRLTTKSSRLVSVVLPLASGPVLGLSFAGGYRVYGRLPSDRAARNQKPSDPAQGSGSSARGGRLVKPLTRDSPDQLSLSRRPAGLPGDVTVHDRPTG
ncbi:piwi-like protein Siwi [Macrobrachium nipponense]|uniref:piwi-like protein Siwi n=1 Tax=Macrobrachium nipponense TaxID=159736 RepID=UPI0030C8BC4A